MTTPTAETDIVAPSQIVGRLERGGVTVAEVDAGGEWAASDPALTEIYNLLYGPGSGVLLPRATLRGVEALYAAAAARGLDAVQLYFPHPLPPGAIS